MKRWYKLILPVLVSSAFLCGYVSPKDRQYVDYFLRLQAADLFKKQSFLLNWSCAYVNHLRIEGVDMSFSCYRVLTQPQARKLIVSVALEIVKKINSDPILKERKFLEEPFTIDRLYLKIETNNVMSQQAEVETIQKIYLDRGQITYITYPASTLVTGYPTTYEETLELAMMYLGESTPFKGGPMQAEVSQKEEPMPPMPLPQPDTSEPLPKPSQQQIELPLTTNPSVHRLYDADVTIPTPVVGKTSPGATWGDDSLTGAGKIEKSVLNEPSENLLKSSQSQKATFFSTAYLSDSSAAPTGTVALNDIDSPSFSSKGENLEAWRGVDFPSGQVADVYEKVLETDNPLQSAKNTPNTRRVFVAAEEFPKTSIDALPLAFLMWNETPDVPKYAVDSALDQDPSIVFGLVADSQIENDGVEAQNETIGDNQPPTPPIEESSSPYQRFMDWCKQRTEEEQKRVSSNHKEEKGQLPDSPTGFKEPLSVDASVQSIETPSDVCPSKPQEPISLESRLHTIGEEVSLKFEDDLQSNTIAKQLPGGASNEEKTQTISHLGLSYDDSLSGLLKGLPIAVEESTIVEAGQVPKAIQGFWSACTSPSEEAHPSCMGNGFGSVRSSDVELCVADKCMGAAKDCWVSCTKPSESSEMPTGPEEMCVADKCMDAAKDCWVSCTKPSESSEMPAGPEEVCVADKCMDAAKDCWVSCTKPSESSEMPTGPGEVCVADKCMDVAKECWVSCTTPDEEKHPSCCEEDERVAVFASGSELCSLDDGIDALKDLWETITGSLGLGLENSQSVCMGLNEVCSPDDIRDELDENDDDQNPDERALAQTSDKKSILDSICLFFYDGQGAPPEYIPENETLSEEQEEKTDVDNDAELLLSDAGDY